MNCPHCEKEIPVDMLAKLADESRIVMVLEPAEGELFDIKTVGGVLTELAKLLEEQGRAMGACSVITLLEKIEHGEAGKLHLHMIVARSPDKVISRKARA